MEYLGGIFDGLIGPLLFWIKGKGVGPGLAGLISIAGVSALIYAFTGWYRDSTLLDRAVTAIGRRDAKEFAKDFNEISEKLIAVDKIKIAWAEFSETLIRPRFSDASELLSPCENTTRPQSFFNLKELGMGPDFIKVLPSVFVGVGLSLTFLGLIAALAEASDAITGVARNTSQLESFNQTKEIQGAISRLLEISSAKFYASLFALFMSVLLTLAIRGISSSLNAKLRGLNRRLEECVRFLTPERLAIEANDLLRNQLAQLQTFNTDLAMKIGQEVQSSLQPVINKLDTISDGMADKNIDAIKEIAHEVTRGIQGAAGGAMDRVAQILDEVSTKLGKLSETLGGALSNFDADFKQMMEGLKASLQEGTKGVADGVAVSMNEMAQGVNTTASEIGNVLANFSSTLERLGATGEEISRQGGEALRAQVQAASEEASRQIASAGKEMAEGFSQTTSEFVQSLASATTQLRSMEKSLLELPAELQNINDALGTSAGQVRTAADYFGEASSGLRAVVDPLAEYAVQTKRAIEQVAEQFAGISGQVSTAVDGMNKVVSALEDQLSAEIRRLDGADETLGRLLSGINDSTNQVISTLNNYVSSVDRGFANSLSLLGESVQDFEQVVDGLKQAIQNNNR